METQTITAKQIHDDFYGAEERLYVDAIGLQHRAPDRSKASRLKRIGFGMAKPVIDAKDFEGRKDVSKLIIEAIEYYRIHYPMNKFITESEVEKLCKKYSLVFGNASNYIGDMPEKNLAEIEKFKLRKEDWQEKNNYDFSPGGGLESIIGTWTHFLEATETARREYGMAIRRNFKNNYFQEPSRQIEKEVETAQPPFKICAPHQDFNTLGYEVRDGYKLVWDPIVLQPVKFKNIEAHLIVTAWGDEASDELVVNEINN